MFAQTSTRQYDIDIAPLPLSQALQLFSKQTGLQHGYLPQDDEEEQLLVGPIKGRYTADEALAKLLPAGFKFEWINRRTVSIVSPPANAPPGGVSEAVASEDRQRLEISKEQQVSMAYGDKSGSARSPYAFEGKMIVEASKIFDDLDLDIPTTVLDRGDIEALGASTVADLLKYVTQQTHTMSESYLGDGTQFADLRGLGFDTTLVLINGRRTIASASSLSVNAFDLNIIPLAAVERIDVVSDSMSAIHGADAIGGVLNIVLREDIPEPRLDIDYGAAEGGAVERHAAFSASGTTGRARGSIVLDYFDRSPLLGRERDRWNNQDFRRFGGIDWRSPTASPGNVRSTNLENLPGLPSSFAAIPAVSALMPLTPTDFLPTAGQQNLESLYRHVSLLGEVRRSAVSAQGEYRLMSNLSAFVSLLYVDRENRRQLEPSALFGALVPATNPHNPFGTDVLVDALLTDLGPRTFSRRGDMLSAVGGVRGQIGEWAWETSLHKGQDDAVTVDANRADAPRVAASLSATDADDALNLFGANSPDLLASLLAPAARSRFRTEMMQAAAYVRGPLFTLPAGRADLIVGGERRKEEAQYDITLGSAVSGSHQRWVTAVFGEVRLPVVNAAAKIPAVHDLSLILSGRFDGYSDIGDSFNPEYTLLWRPTPAVTLRTALSQSFRPPPLFDLYMPLVDQVAPTPDPARNNELTFPIWRAGGNAHLKPSNAHSFATSLELAPIGMSNLRIAATYWRIRMDERIGIPSGDRILAAEGNFAERVVRGEPSAADVAAGIPGPLELIDVTRLNFGSVHTSGVDFSAAVVLDTRVGRFMPELSATWVHDFTASDLVEGSNVSRVGVADLQGTVARWRAVASLQWGVQGIGISANARYVPAYHDVDLPDHRNGRTVEAQLLLDAQVAFDLSDLISPESMWQGFELRAGVSNLLNDEPPFAEAGLLMGYDPSQSDLRQRFVYLKLSKTF